jgi:predicted NAD-dependent protein-ADP-ribosyltransferase YbiA (DUF1768 family)
MGFNNDANLSVMIPGFGLFPTATSAFSAFKDPSNTEYVGSLETETDLIRIHQISKSCQPHEYWNCIRESVMYTVLKYKFNQHDIIRKNLSDTGLRQIVVRSKDPFWGKFETYGKNMIGKILIKIRKEMYINN